MKLNNIQDNVLEYTKLTRATFGLMFFMVAPVMFVIYIVNDFSVSFIEGLYSAFTEKV